MDGLPPTPHDLAILRNDVDAIRANMVKKEYLHPWVLSVNSHLVMTRFYLGAIVALLALILWRVW